jgi:Asp-tRNA(Asn)/Glu-tRNA(Gln) amidotransferase A subunit family amidase
MDDLAYSHAHDIREMIKNKKISAVELTQHFLDRIDKYNDYYQAYNWVIPEQAMEDARRVDQWVAEGKVDLPLLGVPCIIDGGLRVSGTPLSYGCEMSMEEFPTIDGADVKVLKDSGIIILGKGNTSEFGLTATTINSLSPQAKNPFNELYSAGGSGGGSAVAVAKGLAALAIGPDKNGGMRLPASYCGLTSIKPTRGRVPLIRRFPLSMINKAITQVSPIARCVRDASIVLNVLAYDEKADEDRLRIGHDNYEKMCNEPLRPVKIGWIPEFDQFPTDPDVAEICSRSVKLISGRGYHVDEIELDIDVEILKHYCNVFSCEHYIPIVSACEWDTSGMCDRLTRGTHRWLNYAKTVSGVSVSLGINQFNMIRKRFNDLLADYDLLITPASAMMPFTLDELEEQDITDGCFKYSLKSLSYLLLNNLSGHPSLVMPAGVNVAGIPVGLNIITKYCDESLLVQFASSMEETFDLHGKSAFV